jgi:hypothetical protein
MIISDKKITFAQLLKLQIGQHGAEIIAQVQSAGGLKARQNTHIKISK